MCPGGGRPDRHRQTRSHDPSLPVRLAGTLIILVPSDSESDRWLSSSLGSLRPDSGVTVTRLSASDTVPAVTVTLTQLETRYQFASDQAAATTMILSRPRRPRGGRPSPGAAGPQPRPASPEPASSRVTSLGLGGDST